MKKRPYIIAMVIFVAAYLLLEIKLGTSQLADIVTTILAIIAGVAFWLELKSNDQLNEAKFIMELNNQFISNSELTKVERALEKYFAKYREEEKKGEPIDEISLELNLDINNLERQMLVNYLVHLEGIAALVNKKVLKLETITDLMAYRYFIAVNNPVVQEKELFPYQPYYQGCFKLYDAWQNKLGNDVPMKGTALPDRLKIYEEQKRKESEARQSKEHC